MRTAITGVCIGGLFHGRVIRALPDLPAPVRRMGVGREVYRHMRNEFGDWWVAT